MIHSLSASDLLDLSERGAGCPPVEQALLLLHAAAPGLPGDELARLPLGQRDAILLELRQRTFGGHINGLAACPVCRERVELDFEIGDLLASFPGYSRQAVLPAELPTLNFSEAGYEIAFRLPASATCAAGLWNSTA